DFAAAETRARDIAGDPAATAEDRAAAQTVLGFALEGAGRTGEAFTAFATGKAIVRQRFQRQFERDDVETYPARLKRLSAWAEGLTRDAWRPDAGGDADLRGATGHVFVLGFPRSGATLLQLALASRSDVAALGENDALGRAGEEA